MRKANTGWLAKSSALAVRVLSTLRVKKWSQKDLAEIIGVTPQHINKIVKGQENLSLDTIAKLETALGIELIEIVGVNATVIYTVPTKTDFNLKPAINGEMLTMKAPIKQTYSKPEYLQQVNNRA